MALGTGITFHNHRLLSNNWHLMHLYSDFAFTFWVTKGGHPMQTYLKAMSEKSFFSRAITDIWSDTVISVPQNNMEVK